MRRPSASDVSRPRSIACLAYDCARAGPRATLGGQRQRPRVQLLGRDDLVGEPDAQRLVGLDLATGDAQLLGAARADQPRQALRAAATGDDAEQDLGLAEHGPLTGDPIVAREGQLAASSEGVPGDGGDDHARDRRHRVERAVDRRR